MDQRLILSDGYINQPLGPYSLQNYFSFHINPL